MKLTPTPVVSSLGHSELVIAIAAGYYHTLALTSNGELYTYGRNDYGQLGLGTLEHTFRPTRVPVLFEMFVLFESQVVAITLLFWMNTDVFLVSEEIITVNSELEIFWTRTHPDVFMDSLSYGSKVLQLVSITHFVLRRHK